MGNITIDEDDLSDEYDFMEDDNDQAREERRRAKEQRKIPQPKYKLMLQELADRTIDEIRIDLDDLVTVSLHLSFARTTAD